MVVVEVKPDEGDTSPIIRLASSRILGCCDVDRRSSVQHSMSFGLAEVKYDQGDVRLRTFFIALASD